MCSRGQPAQAPLSSACWPRLARQYEVAGTVRAQEAAAVAARAARPPRYPRPAGQQSARVVFESTQKVEAEPADTERIRQLEADIERLTDPAAANLADLIFERFKEEVNPHIGATKQNVGVRWDEGFKQPPKRLRDLVTFEQAAAAVRPLLRKYPAGSATTLMEATAYALRPTAFFVKGLEVFDGRTEVTVDWDKARTTTVFKHAKYTPTWTHRHRDGHDATQARKQVEYAMEHAKEKLITHIHLYAHEERLRRLEDAPSEDGPALQELEGRCSQLEKQLKDLTDLAPSEPCGEPEPDAGSVVVELRRMKRQHADLVDQLKRRRVLADEPDEEDMRCDPLEEKRKLARLFTGKSPEW